jgi:hypothetical protein
MLANLPSTTKPVGVLAGDIPKAASFRYELVEFIANALPVWRDREDRPHETSETALTSQVCAHLNSVARHAKGWDILQFRVEEGDEQRAGRKIDMVAAPSGTSITIEGRKHVDFDSLMPIECKRLPVPKGSERDAREYVFSSKGTTGGIQRFKAGYHGSHHSLGAMIAYVQEDRCEAWQARINNWIAELINVQPGWTVNDRLALESADEARR